ncbi:uncharacterized protein SCHCODRAFT_02643771 [Schizophyllum commune H4-8]|uniref:uncharacterized protein n=1 Tax=Schizophyllum commune (strain H4-8 / FGSC 9210) TaxID=578458 RepID=UPI00215EAE2A|nr:uncharacterized protein SCHCODRAFT_02643771 [Schizophyllum commune H4-8]KAI5885556.1 hypothetical protein SCHCODRAFT_02643771 [Schizophyllum commune H4-8]
MLGSVTPHYTLSNTHKNHPRDPRRLSIPPSGHPRALHVPLYRKPRPRAPAAPASLGWPATFSAALPPSFLTDEPSSLRSYPFSVVHPPSLPLSLFLGLL